MSTLRLQNAVAALPRKALAIAALVSTLAGCNIDKLLTVHDPAVATPESLSNPESIPVLVAGAIGDFQGAYSGRGDDAFLSNSANFTDEMNSAGTFTTRGATDQRDQQPIPVGNTTDAAYTRLHQARRAAKDAAAAVANVSGTSDPDYSRLKMLEGYTYVALAEGFCAPLPFSNVVDGERVDGDPIPQAAVFDSAVVRFDDAIASNSADMAARVGKGRALLDNGQYAAAAAAVASVPTSYVYFIEHSSTSSRQYNPLFSLQGNGRYTVSDQEGTNGIPFRSANDPRLPWYDAGGGFDASIELYINMRYPSFDSDVPLADGIEARLIEAEAALNAGDASWLTILNALRADVANLMAARYDSYAINLAASNVTATTLAPLTDPGTAAARVDLLFRERAFWLYATGHRLGDMRRLIRQYNRTQDTVFPVGAYHRGGVYGTDVNFPVAFDEANNTKYDISMCNTKTP